MKIILNYTDFTQVFRLPKLQVISVFLVYSGIFNNSRCFRYFAIYTLYCKQYTGIFSSNMPYFRHHMLYSLNNSYMRIYTLNLCLKDSKCMLYVLFLLKCNHRTEFSSGYLLGHKELI